MTLRFDLGAITQWLEIYGERFETTLPVGGLFINDNFGLAAGGRLGVKNMLCQYRISRIKPAAPNLF